MNIITCYRFDGITQINRLYQRSIGSQIKLSKYRIRQVITKMRRLVVCYVLPCYPHTVYMIMHQRRESIVCWDICCEDIKMTTICTTPENHLLTPITE